MTVDPEPLLSRGNAALAEGDWTAARNAFEEALSECETAESHEGLSWAAMWLEDGSLAPAGPPIDSIGSPGTTLARREWGCGPVWTTRNFEANSRW